MELVTTDNGHSAHSGTREKVLEHLFVGDLLRCLWRDGRRDVEVLRAEVDKGGYDLVLEANAIIRHVQLKSSHRAAKTDGVSININLARKPSGCVIWLLFDLDSMELGPFLWFGGSPGAPLPPLGNRVIKHTKANKDGIKTERPNIRELRRGQFQVLPTMQEVIGALFGNQKGYPAAMSKEEAQP